MRQIMRSAAGIPSLSAQATAATLQGEENVNLSIRAQTGASCYVIRYGCRPIELPRNFWWYWPALVKDHVS